MLRSKETGGLQDTWQKETPCRALLVRRCLLRVALHPWANRPV